MAGSKSDPALTKTQKMKRIAREPRRSARVHFRLTDATLERWERGRKAAHLPTLTAFIACACGQFCDRLGIK